MADEITLTIPREPDFHRVAHLVLGGLAVRLNLTVENLEDLEIALDSILDRSEADGDITVRMALRDGALETRVGPLGSRLLDEIERERGNDLEPAPRARVDRRRRAHRRRLGEPDEEGRDRR